MTALACHAPDCRIEQALRRWIPTLTPGDREPFDTELCVQALDVEPEATALGAT